MDAAASDVALALGAAGKKKKKNKKKKGRENGDGELSSSSSSSSSSGVVVGFGTSDEYSFVLAPNCQIYDRREAKLVSVAASTFAASYVRRWDSFFCPGKKSGGRSDNGGSRSN